MLQFMSESTDEIFFIGVLVVICQFSDSDY